MAVTIPLLELLGGKTRILLSFWWLITFFGILGGWRLFIVGEAAHVAWTGRKPEPAFRSPRITVSVIAGMIVLAGLLPTPEQYLRMYSYFRAFKVPSDSMCPTICLDERIVADMDAFKTKPLQRGDIILFQQKSFDGLLIKRVIGIGGDFVEPGPKGTILVNGKAPSATQTCGEPILQKDIPEEKPDFPSTRVTEGSFFVVGDNLSRSFDSRIAGFGLVNRDQVRGKPLFVYWSPGRSRIGCPVR